MHGQSFWTRTKAGRTGHSVRAAAGCVEQKRDSGRIPAVQSRESSLGPVQVLTVRIFTSQKISGILNSARQQHTDAVQTRIDSVSQQQGVVDITKGLYAIAKETAQTEKEVFELAQRTKVAAEVKSVLDSWVRFEAQEREEEQRLLSQAVVAKVTAALQDEKLQKQILENAIAEVERESLPFSSFCGCLADPLVCLRIDRARQGQEALNKRFEPTKMTRRAESCSRFATCCFSRNSSLKSASTPTPTSAPVL